MLIVDDVQLKSIQRNLAKEDGSATINPMSLIPSPVVPAAASDKSAAAQGALAGAGAGAGGSAASASSSSSSAAMASSSSSSASAQPGAPTVAGTATPGVSVAVKVTNHIHHTSYIIHHSCSCPNRTEITYMYICARARARVCILLWHILHLWDNQHAFENL
jgi:hypothetical protein